MSENTNEITSDDATMDNSEFETSGMIEETNKMDEPHAIMDSAEFEARLTDFFTKHKKTKLKLVSQIAFEFKGQEKAVLEHLNNKYVLGVVAEKPKGKTAHKTEEHTEHSQNIESSGEVKPKSKKKLIVVIIIVVILAGLGVTGFMMKDKLLGMTGKGHETEKAEVKPEGESHKVAAPPKEEVAPKVEAVDSTKTVTNDSVKTN